MGLSCQVVVFWFVAVLCSERESDLPADGAEKIDAEPDVIGFGEPEERS
jgi:hypothetical protein